MSSFLPAFVRWASVYDLRTDDDNTASICKRLKSPVQFTGGLAVYWMSVTFTVTLLEAHSFVQGVLVRNYHRTFANCADPIHQRCSLNLASGSDSSDVYQFTFKNQLMLATYFFRQTDLCT